MQPVAGPELVLCVPICVVDPGSPPPWCTTVRALKPRVKTSSLDAKQVIVSKIRC